MIGFQRLVIEAQLCHGPGAEILQHDIGGLNELQRHVAAFGVLEVEGDRPLVAVVHRKVARSGPFQAPGIIPFQGFNLDDVCSEITQNDARSGAHHHMGKFDNLDSLQWSRLLLRPPGPRHYCLSG